VKINNLLYLREEFLCFNLKIIFDILFADFSNSNDTFENKGAYFINFRINKNMPHLYEYY
jgi:hypothetical protein